MPDTSGPPRPSVLWKQLSSERRQQAAEAFWRDENARSEQADVITAIAQRIKFRPKSVVALSTEKKVRYLMALPQLSELIAARLLVAYHLVHQRPMMAGFLDALSIRHEDGLIADEDVETPTSDRLKSAVGAISAAYPADDVSLYLSTLVWQDSETWGGLTDLLEGMGPAHASSKAGT